METEKKREEKRKVERSPGEGNIDQLEITVNDKGADREVELPSLLEAEIRLEDCIIQS